MFNSKYKIFSPVLIFNCIYLMQIFVQITYLDAINIFSEQMWIILLLAGLAFNVGYLLVPCNSIAKYFTNLSKQNIHKFNFYLLWLFFSLFVYAIYTFYNYLGFNGLVVLNLTQLRELIIFDFMGERELTVVTKILTFGVAISLIILSESKKLSYNYLVGTIIFGILTAILTTGRLNLLLFFSGAATLLYRNGLIRKIHLMYGVVVFISLFFFMALILDKGGNDLSFLDAIIWNSKVYFTSSLSCLNDYTLNSQINEDGLFLPNVIRNFLNLFDLNIALKLNLNEFRYIPEPCNTYTLMYPIYNDFGYIGVSILFLLIGGLHKKLYLNFLYCESSHFWYLFAISLYPLTMIFFEDAYISSLGFWSILLVPLLLKKAYFRAVKVKHF